MKTIKIIIFVVLAVALWKVLPMENVVWSDVFSNFQDFVSDIFSPEIESWIFDNFIVIMLVLGGVILWMLNQLKYANGSKEKIKAKKIKKKKREQTTDNIVIIVTLFLIGFFVLKSDFLDGIFDTKKDYTENLKKLPYVDYEASGIEVESDTIDAFPVNEAKSGDSCIFTSDNSKMVTEWTESQTYSHFITDINFVKYFSFYETENYKYNMSFLQTWFNSDEISRICKFYEP
jgi:hypothetical protein